MKLTKESRIDDLRELIKECKASTLNSHLAFKCKVMLVTLDNLEKELNKD